MKRLFVVLAAGLAVATHAFAADEARATPADAEALVKNAVAYLKRHGREKAFKEFQNPNGPFIYRDLYIIVSDASGKCVAHGADPGRVGKNIMNSTDVDGKSFIRERYDIAAKKGSGWHDYKYKNPADGKIEAKTVYIEKFEDLVVTSGAYKP